MSPLSIGFSVIFLSSSMYLTFFHSFSFPVPPLFSVPRLMSSPRTVVNHILHSESGFSLNVDSILSFLGRLMDLSSKPRSSPPDAFPREVRSVNPATSHQCVSPVCRAPCDTSFTSFLSCKCPFNKTPARGLPTSTRTPPLLPRAPYISFFRGPIAS